MAIDGAVAAGEAWWQEFFSGAWLDVHGQVLSPEHTERELAFLTKALGLEPGMKVLDVPCGDGRITAPLAARGFRLTGVDITPSLLDRARRRCALEGLQVEFRLGDMRQIEDEGAFDAVLNCWGSFGYFDDDGNLAFLRTAARALQPGGRLYIDTHVAESIFPKFRRRDWYPAGDTTVLESRVFDPESGVLKGEWTLIRDGRTEVHRSSIRLYTFREVWQMAQAAGFALYDAFGDFEFGPFGLGAGRLLLILHKAG